MSRIPGTVPLELPGTEPLSSGIPGTEPLTEPEPRYALDGQGRRVLITPENDPDIWRAPPERGFIDNFWESVKQTAAENLPAGVRELLPLDPLRQLQRGNAQGGTSAFLGEVVGGFTGIINPSLAAETGLSFAIGGPGARPAGIAVRKALRGAVGRQTARTAGTVARGAVVNAEQGAAFAGLQRAGQLGPEGFAEDPLGAIGETLAASGVGAGAGAAGGVIAHPLFAFPGVVGEARQKAKLERIKRDLVRENALTKEEAEIVGLNGDAISKIAIGRYGNQDVRVRPILNKDGQPSRNAAGQPRVSIEVKPDTVTWAEKRALDHNPELIGAYRDSLAKGGDRLSQAPPNVNDPVPKFFFPLEKAKEAGYLRRARDLSAKTQTQEKIERIQRGAMKKLQVLRSDSRLPIEQKFALTRVLDEEYVERVGLLLAKDNDTSRGARRKVTRAIAESDLANKTDVLTKLDEAFKVVEERSKNETQRSSLERLIEEVSDPKYGFSKEVIGTVEGLYKRSLSADELLPFSERVRRTIDNGREFIRQAIDFPVRAGRARVVELANSLPGDRAKPFLDRALQARGKVELKTIAEEIVRAQESYLRTSSSQSIRNLLKSVDRNPQREKVYALLAEAQPVEAPEKIKGTSLKVGEKIVDAEIKDGIEEQHVNIFQRVLDTVPQAEKAQFIQDFLNDKLSGFTTTKSRFVGRDEARGVAQNANKPSQREPLLVTDPKTGVSTIDSRALGKMLDKLSIDQITDLKNRMARTIRRGQIEKGLYNRALGFSRKQDVQDGVRQLSGFKDRPERAQRQDRKRHAVKYVVDPVTYWNWLDQISRQDPNAPLNKILHHDLRRPMIQHLQNEADTRRFVIKTSKDTLGIDSQSVKGQYKLVKYLDEKLKSGVNRGQAMTAYALSTDSGRQQALAESGIEVNGKKYKAKDVIADLSAKDRTFVDKMKTFFNQNPFIKKAFSNFLLFEGYEPQRVKGWFSSKRAGQETRLDPDFASFTTSLIDSVDSLKARIKESDKPFDVTDGFLSTFYHVSDKMSLYGELGRGLYRAESLLISDEVRGLIKKKFGNSRLQSLELYLKNIHGQVGHTTTAFDAAVDKAITNFTVSRVALNAFSAAKQSLHLFTLFADGTLDRKALLKAIKEGAAFDKGVGKRMLDNSGMAYLRYNGGRFLQSMLTLSQQDQLPSRLTVLQHKAMVFQRNVDRAIMKTAWRAAELTAEARGLKGPEALEATKDLFEVAAGRDQPTDNPLYSTELEVQAKRSKLLRGSLMFLREQNRVYNVMRRHVVRAVQDPTRANISAAGRALILGLVGNTIGVVAIDQLRRLAFAKEVTPEVVARDAVGNMVGLWYLGAPAATLVDGFFDPKSQRTDRLQGPITSIVSDVLEGSWAIGSALTNEDGESVQSGVNRGESKDQKAMMTALDSALSAGSGILGLPFWAIWSQGKGLYRWTRSDLILMTELEQERLRLKAEGEENSVRGRELQSLKERVNEIHRRREKGLISQDEAQADISDLLKSGLN